MPFYKKIEENGAIIGLWEMTETVEALEEIYQLNKYDKSIYKNLTHESRKKEFLAVRTLLRHLTDDKLEIVYNENGKPALFNSSLKISISHNKSFVAIILSKQNVGIDIELLFRKTEKIYPRYLSAVEINQIKNSEDGLIFWAAKEAIYKCLNKKGIIFNKQIKIEIENDYQFFYGYYLKDNYKQKFQLYGKRIAGSILVYAVER